MTPAGAAAGADQDAGYAGFARRLMASGLVTDPWFDGQPRFQVAPLPLARADLDAMMRATEAVAAVLDELCGIVAADPAALDDFFAMTPAQKLMWQASAPLWHGIARADVFLRDGQPPVVCEMNCDTPSGLAEAVCLGQLAAAAGLARREPRPRRALPGGAVAFRRARAAARGRRPDHGRHRLPDGDDGRPRPGRSLSRLVRRRRDTTSCSARRTTWSASPAVASRCSAAAATSCCATTRPTGGASGCRCATTSSRSPIPIRCRSRWRRCCAPSWPARSRW